MVLKPSIRKKDNVAKKKDLRYLGLVYKREKFEIYYESKIISKENL